MPHFAVTLFGADAPGTIAVVARELALQGCNLEDCSATTVRGHSALVLMVFGPAGTGPALAATLSAVARDLNVEIHVTAADEATPSSGTRYAITFHGADQPRLISGVSGILADHGANIVDLKSSATGKPARMYLMRFEVEIPQGKVKTVEAALTAQATRLGIQPGTLDRVPTGQIAAAVQIKDVRLQNSFFQLDELVPEEELGYYRTGYFAEVKTMDQEQLVVAAEFQLVLRPPGQEPAASSTATLLDTQPLKASATYHIDYSARWGNSQPPWDDVQAFADVNAIFNSWPYWRQLVHSTLPRMGVHKLVIPVFRLPLPVPS